MTSISSRPRAALLLLGLIAAANCGREPLGPVGGRPATVRLTPTFPSLRLDGRTDPFSIASIVPFTRVRIVLLRATGDTAAQRLVDFPADSTTLALAITVPLDATAPTTGETLAAHLRLMNAAGDTVFRGGPVAVLAVPPTAATPPAPEIPLTYAGAGVTAATVTITPRLTTARTGGTIAFGAVVRDAAGATLAGTPVAYTSLDTTTIRVDVASGAATILGAAGVGRVVAQTLTGQRDTATVTIDPTILPGTNVVQYAFDWEISSRNPLAVLVRDRGGKPLAAVPVTYAVTTGNGTVAGGSSAVVNTDAQGVATFFDWRTPTGLAGTYALTATIPGGQAPITFTMNKRQTYGGMTTCRMAGGSAYCWGGNYRGEAGTGGSTAQLTPAAVTGGVPLVSLARGHRSLHTCGLTSAGTAYCWGDNTMGQLGTGTIAAAPSPAPVAVSGGLTFKALFRGVASTCGVSTTDQLYCWGWMSQSRLGDGTVGDVKPQPTLASVGGLAFTDVALAMDGTCGLTASGGVHCWNNVYFGMLGENVPARSAPISTPIPGLTATRVFAGDRTFCAIETGGGVKCWGVDAEFGQFGNGGTTMSIAPTSVTLPAGTVVTDLQFAAYTTVCALTSTGRIYCWGRNGDGQVGDGSTTTRLLPVEVGAGIGFQAFHPIGTEVSVCAIANDGASYCWGAGPLGDGTFTTSLVPKRIPVP